jgi:hypothetical protein
MPNQHGISLLSVERQGKIRPLLQLSAVPLSLNKEHSTPNQHGMSLLSAERQFKIRPCVYLPLPIFALLEIFF